MPFIQQCPKVLSADRPYQSFEWFGDATWNGVSTFNNNVGLGSYTYIQNTVELNMIEVNGITYYDFVPGRYFFVSPTFILDRPIYIRYPNNSGTLAITGTIVYTDAFSTGAPLFNGDVLSSGGSLSIFRTDNAVFATTAPVAFIDIVSSSNTGVFIMSFCGISGFQSQGVVDNFAIVNIDSPNITNCAAGLLLFDTAQLISLNKLNMSNSLAPMTYITIDSSVLTQPLITCSSTTFVLTDHGAQYDTGFYITTNLLPNAEFIGGVYDDRLASIPPPVSRFFDAAGYTQEDPRLVLASVKNVADSSTSVEYYWSGNQLQSTTVTLQYTLLEMPGTVTVDELERISVDSFYIATNLTLERGRLQLTCQLTLEGGSSTTNFELRFAKFGASFAGTGSSATNAITSVSHGLLNGDNVWLGTNGVGLSEYCVYYVVNATADTFQLSNTAAGTPLALLTGACDISKIEFIAQSSKVAVGNNLSSTVTIYALTTSVVGERYAPLLRSATGSKAVNLQSTNVVITK